jgi:mannose-6-phosphate isomerase-like protein (cupin superfamily)
MSASNGNAVPPLGQCSTTPDAIAPDGSEIRFLVGSDQGATKSSLVEVTLAPGEVTRPVKHRTVEEVWYVLEGSGLVWRCPPKAASANVDAVSIAFGDTLVIPTGWGFQFSANENSQLRFLCHTTPPWPGEHEAVPLEDGGFGCATV